MILSLLVLIFSLHLIPQQLPKDTLVIDGRAYVGVAMPMTVNAVRGDVTNDKRVSTADIIALVGYVLKAQALPPTDTLAFAFRYGGKDWYFVLGGGVR